MSGRLSGVEDGRGEMTYDMTKDSFGSPSIFISFDLCILR